MWKLRLQRYLCESRHQFVVYCQCHECNQNCLPTNFHKYKFTLKVIKQTYININLQVTHFLIERAIILVYDCVIFRDLINISNQCSSISFLHTYILMTFLVEFESPIYYTKPSPPVSNLINEFTVIT